MASDMTPTKPGPTLCLPTEDGGEEAGRGKERRKERGRSEAEREGKEVRDKGIVG